MIRTIGFKRVARAEFDDAIAFYEKRELGLGLRFENATNTVLERIRKNPEHFFKLTHSVHKARVPKFPHSIYFTEVAEQIIVVSVYHGARNPDELKRRLR